MTTASPATMSPDVADALNRAVADTDAQISRTDSKASLLLAFDGAALAGLASVADTPLPILGTVAGAAAIGALAVSAVLLLLVVRPHLRDDDHGSFPYWSTLTGDDQVRAAVTTGSKETRLRALSGIALRKYTQLQRAVDVILGALALLAVTAACAA
ncbi:Pycsar system effector family protein [Streptomyces sp. NRRL F-5123]|uniref:Pycsar system effector family protein n=1 Tax=Streptomyces sp. NRRL F-5123 TaxID=1463856 RepID=UPI000A7142B0|nr:Pycsar system effector family protein [Streptomyces sp. NRRL F-5123]